MNIGFDGSILSLPFPSGTKEYAQSLLENLAKLNTGDTLTVFGSEKMVLPKGNFHHVIIPSSIPIFKKQLFLTHMVKKSHIDMFHYLDPFGSFFPVHKKTITTVHDVDLSQTYPWLSKDLLHRLYCEPMRYGVLRSTSVIITDTLQIKHEVEEYLHKMGLFSKIKTIPLGYDINTFKLKHKKTNDKHNQYFLSMGDFAPRKNIKKVFQAYKDYRKKSGKAELYLVISSQNYVSKFNQLLEHSNINPSAVKMHVNIPKDQLADMYANAIAFLYPSLYEGFGIPLLEAMATGCPVVTSHYGAMSEVAGNAAILVDPRCESEISAAMKLIEDNDNVAKKLSQLGIQRASKFSWQINAKKTYIEYLQLFRQSASDE